MIKVIHCRECLYWTRIKPLSEVGICECVPEEWFDSDPEITDPVVKTQYDDFCSLAVRREAIG